MKEQELTGMPVLISPVLWTLAYMGEIGEIVATDFSNEEIEVRFPDGETGLFSPKTVFVIKTADELSQLAANEQGYLWRPLPKQLGKLAISKATGEKKYLIDALKLVKDDPELHRLATVRLNEVVDLELKRKVGR